MNFWKEIGNKTWIDWIKIIVAIDIAGVGIGLILGFNLHVFANLLGFLSRIFFGVLYVFVAVLIFKRIFPQKLAEDEHREAQKMDEDIKKTTHTVGKKVGELAQVAEKVTQQAHEKIDTFLDSTENFFGKRKEEARNEVKKLMDE